ncbi:MAG: biotin synthase BioB [Thermanaerothrix sp.]|nr:biotin synthase BioB [Thermanaerothrix sp.]
MRLALNLARRVLGGGSLSPEEGLSLFSAPLDELMEGSSMIRQALVPPGVELCAICSVHTGSCSEDCGFCAQSSRGPLGAEVLGGEMEDQDVLVMAQRAASFGVSRFSLVSSGFKAPERVLRMAVRLAPAVRSMGLSPCVSLGFLSRDELKALKDAGVERIHCNLETSPAFFPSICSTHRWSMKLEFIREASAMGFEVCSGGIMGMGESLEDLVSLGLWSFNAGAASFPLNILSPIKGTPLEGRPPVKGEDFLRFACVLRYLMPFSRIRIAGGRPIIRPFDRAALSGPVDSLMTGDFLTTHGMSFEEDLRMLDELGLRPLGKVL